MRFEIKKTDIKLLTLITRKTIGDSRGSFSRLFCAEELSHAGWKKNIAQINHTVTEKAGTVRGMHFQHPPYAEMKLVTCLRGAVWDVAVDLRKGSATFLHFYAIELSGANKLSLLIPEGFAHGFQTLVDDCELIYLHSTAYEPEAESALNPKDPMLQISWPLTISNISNKDAGTEMLSPQFKGLIL